MQGRQVTSCRAQEQTRFNRRCHHHKCSRKTFDSHTVPCELGSSRSCNKLCPNPDQCVSGSRCQKSSAPESGESSSTNDQLALVYGDVHVQIRTYRRTAAIQTRVSIQSRSSGVDYPYSQTESRARRHPTVADPLDVRFMAEQTTSRVFGPVHHCSQHPGARS